MSNVESEVDNLQPSCWMQRNRHQTSTLTFDTQHNRCCLLNRSWDAAECALQPVLCIWTEMP